MVSTGEITADDDMVLEDNLVGPSGEHIPLPLAKDVSPTVYLSFPIFRTKTIH